MLLFQILRISLTHTIALGKEVRNPAHSAVIHLAHVGPMLMGLLCVAQQRDFERSFRRLLVVVAALVMFVVVPVLMTVRLHGKFSSQVETDRSQID